MSFQKNNSNQFKVQASLEYIMGKKKKVERGAIPSETNVPDQPSKSPIFESTRPSTSSNNNNNNNNITDITTTNNNNNNNNNTNTNANTNHNESAALSQNANSLSRLNFLEVSAQDFSQKLNELNLKSLNAKTHVQVVEPVWPVVCPKFDVDDPKANAYLEQNGFVVFKQVASPDDIETAIKLFWDFVVYTSGSKVDPKDPHSWGNSNWPCSRTGTGIFYEHGVGQSQFLWHCRSLPKVRKLFELIWGDTDVLSSFDGCGAFRPPELGTDYSTKAGWYHVDQNGAKKKFKCCVQGLLNLLPSGADDGGLTLLPKSHLIFELLFKVSFQNNKKDFCMMKKTDKVWDIAQKTGLHMIKPILDPGDFVLWDSRVIHCNSPAKILAPSERGPSGLRRLVTYICMLPSSHILDEKVIVDRIQGVKRLTTTNHWPSEFTPSSENQSFPNLPRAPMSEDRILLVTGQKYRKYWK